MAEHTLITPRRNFLIRALGFTVAGATVPISIITADDAKARMEHHRVELERAWRDYYGVSHQCQDCPPSLTGGARGGSGGLPAALGDKHLHDLRRRRQRRRLSNETARRFTPGGFSGRNIC